MGRTAHGSHEELQRSRNRRGREVRVGRQKSGTGSMEITSVAPNREIDVDLRFTRPWKAINPTTFTFEPTAQGTRVTWTMRGENKGISALFAKFFNMDKMLGKDFELGLNQLSNAARNS
ncbi:SRPBCC family protein [Neomicrococcus lactis]